MKHPLSKSATFPRTACFGPVLCAALAGCGEAPPQVPPQPVEATRPKPRAALKLPPRVVPVRSGTTEFIGKLGSKSVYSVGAERWVVDEPGKAEREAAPLGDLLFGVIPFAQGEVKALGWNTFRAFGFTDVLVTRQTGVPCRWPVSCWVSVRRVLSAPYCKCLLES